MALPLFTGAGTQQRR